jgi:hypothetical protein
MYGGNDFLARKAHGVRGAAAVPTWYVRGAHGNVMSGYTQGDSAINGRSLTQSEADLYGSIST